MSSVDLKAPSSTAAVRTDRFSYVFFCRGDNRLGYLQGDLLSKARTSKQDPFQYYAKSIITEDSVTVENHRESTQITALSYKDGGGNTQVRVYFVDSNGKLAEICTQETAKGLPPWSWGSLSEGGGKAVTPKSMVSSTVSTGTNGRLSVFYQLEEGGRLRVAQVTTGTTAWNDYDVNNIWDA